MSVSNRCTYIWLKIGFNCWCCLFCSKNFAIARHSFLSLDRTPHYRFCCLNTKVKWKMSVSSREKKIHCIEFTGKFTWSFDFVGYFFVFIVIFMHKNPLIFWCTCLLLKVQSWTMLTLNNEPSSIEALINVLLITKPKYCSMSSKFNYTNCIISHFNAKPDLKFQQSD